MKKIIKLIGLLIFLGILSLIVVAVFNPYKLRTKIIAKALNYYLSNNIEGYTPLETSSTTEMKVDKNQNTSSTEIVPVAVDKNPLLNAEQEKTLEGLGVDVSKLPTVISPDMKTCFLEKVGAERANELIKGAIPSAVELLKVKGCLSN